MMKNKEKTNRFERHPLLTLFIIVFVCAVLLDFSAANIYRRIKGYPWPEKERVLRETMLEKTKIIEQSYRVTSVFYHHDLAKNKSVNNAVWGYLHYTVCTNSLGFKDRVVRDVPLSSDKHRIVFIGDSFTEGTGYSYDDTFVGLIDSELSKQGIEVFNAAVGGYSPIIYWKKIEYLINNAGFKFNEVVVFIDISDIQDVALFYFLDEKGNVDKKNLYYEIFLNRISHQTEKSIHFADKMVNHSESFLKNNSILMYYLFNKLLLLLNIENANHYNNDSLEYRRSLWTTDKKLYDEYGEKGLRECSLYMDKLHALLKSRGISLTVAVYPWPGQVLYDSPDSIQVRYWKKWCSDRDVTFINCFSYLMTGKTEKEKERIIDKYYIRNDVHFNEDGHKLIANVFLDYYKNRKK